MPELPVCGTWSLEELQLLYEVANYWAIGTVDTLNGSQKVIEWTSAVEEMNISSKKYFISNREYTFEECYDQFLLHWGKDLPGDRNSRFSWTAGEMELMQEASVTVPRRRGLPPSNCHKFVPDYEGIKIFMNREAFKRGIRRRYYTAGAVEYAYRKESWGILPTQKQATDDLANPKRAGIAASQFANIRTEIVHSNDEGISNGDAALHEGGRLQLHAGFSPNQTCAALAEQKFDLPFILGEMACHQLLMGCSHRHDPVEYKHSYQFDCWSHGRRLTF